MAIASLIVLLLSAAPPTGASPTIAWAETAGAGEVQVCGLPAAELARLAAEAPEQLEARLEVKAVDGEAAEASLGGLPSLWGSFAFERDCLLFRPRHQPAPGMVLIARYLGGDGREPLILRQTFAKPAGPTRVIAVHPAAQEIPENLLRFYVEFSAPMSIKGIDRHVRLRDQQGREITNAFVPIPDGLWDPELRRLTLIVHPGRVKSGITVGEVEGRVLEAGREVTLEIDAAARDSFGARLAETYRQTFRIGPAQKEALDAEALHLGLEGEGETAPLRISFPVLVDFALATAASAVERAREKVPGRFELAPGGRELLFHPQEPWQRGQEHVLKFGEIFEDAAGNRFGRAFEKQIDDPAAAKAVELKFTPG